MDTGRLHGKLWFTGSYFGDYTGPANSALFTLYKDHWIYIVILKNLRKGTYIIWLNLKQFTGFSAKAYLTISNPR